MYVLGRVLNYNPAVGNATEMTSYFILSADVIRGGTYPRSSDDDKWPMNGGYIGLGQG